MPLYQCLCFKGSKSGFWKSPRRLSGVAPQRMPAEKAGQWSSSPSSSQWAELSQTSLLERVEQSRQPQQLSSREATEWDPV